jgi:hypothetical protein
VIAVGGLQAEDPLQDLYLKIKMAVSQPSSSLCIFETLSCLQRADTDEAEVAAVRRFLSSQQTSFGDELIGLWCAIFAVRRRSSSSMRT